MLAIVVAEIVNRIWPAMRFAAFAREDLLHFPSLRIVLEDRISQGVVNGLWRIDYHGSDRPLKHRDIRLPVTWPGKGGASGLV